MSNTNLPISGGNNEDEKKEASPININRNDARGNDCKFYEFNSHFSYKSLYDKLEVLKNELNVSNRDASNKQNGHTTKKTQVNNNEYGKSRNILLNHFVNNNVIEESNNSSIKNSNKTYQAVNNIDIKKSDLMNLSIQNKQKEFVEKNDNAEYKNNIKPQKQVFTNKRIKEKKPSNALLLYKKKNTERNATSMGHPKKINCNLGKVVYKPNSRSHPPLTRQKPKAKDAVIHIQAIQAKVVHSSSKPKSTSKPKKPTSLNISVKFNPSQQQNGKTNLESNITSRKTKEASTLFEENKGKTINKSPFIIMNKKINTLTSNKNNPKQTKLKQNTPSVNQNRKNHSQEKKLNLNLQFGSQNQNTQPNLKLQANGNSTVNQKSNNQSLNKNKLNNSLRPTLNITKEIKSKPKQILLSNLTKPKNPKQIEITLSNKKSPKNKEVANCSSSRNKRSSLESIDLINPKAQNNAKIHKDKMCVSTYQIQLLTKKNNHIDNNNNSNDKIFHTLDNTYFKQSTCKSKNGQSGYNTNPNSEIGHNQSNCKSNILKGVETNQVTSKKQNRCSKKIGSVLNLIKNDIKFRMKKGSSNQLK